MQHIRYCEVCFNKSSDSGNLSKMWVRHYLSLLPFCPTWFHRSQFSASWEIRILHYIHSIPQQCSLSTSKQCSSKNTHGNCFSYIVPTEGSWKMDSIQWIILWHTLITLHYVIRIILYESCCYGPSYFLGSERYTNLYADRDRGKWDNYSDR